MMRRKPENRFRTGEEVARALESALAGSHDAITPVVGVASGGSIATSQVRDPLMTPQDGVVRSPKTPPRDNTPKRQVHPEKSLPRKQRTSLMRNYIPVATILTAAVVMGVLLWNGLQNTKSAVVVPPDASSVEVTGNAKLESVRTFDPEGDSVENEELVANLTDGSATTTWSTVCYVNRSFGSKQGVGLVLALSELGIGTVKTTFAAAPYDLDVYTVDGPAPSSLEGWGFAQSNVAGADTGAIDIPVTTPATHILLFFNEVGPHPSCSNNNPYKGEVAEVEFYPTAPQ
jgi:hypothetical protein